MTKTSNGKGDKRTQDKALSKEYSKRRNRLVLFGIVFNLCLCALLVRVFYIKSVYGDEYEKRAIENELSNLEKTLAPIRGAILDRNKQPLVVSHSVDDIILDIRRLVKEKKEVQDKTLKVLNEYLDIPMDTMEGYLARNADGSLVNDTHHKKIAIGISKKVSNEMMEKGIKCVHAEETSSRNYVHNTLASQILGFIRGDGSWGLENRYDKELSGLQGRTFSTFENTSAVSNQIPAQDGQTLITTLDINIQQIAEKAAIENANFYEAQNALVLVMNPKTGEIYAMADSSGFDPNQPSNEDLFTDSRERDRIKDLTDEEYIDALYKVWGNFNIAESIEPGSIFKPLVVAAALEEKLVSDLSTFHCGGGKNIYTEHIQCWIAVYPARAHGRLTLAQGLAQSCNVMMMDIAELMGRDLFYKYQHDFGIGEKTGIDLPGEMDAASLVHSLAALNPVELAASSIGQTFKVTPLQAITSFSALINGGNLMVPYVVSHIFDSDGNLVKETTPTVQRRVISQETSYYMRSVLKDVVAPNGTGNKAIIEGYSIGGKTGTAEQGRKEPKEYALSFMAYLPAENPELIALAIINRPKDYYEGSTSTAPMLKAVLEDIIKYKGMQPTAGGEEQTTLLDGNEITLDSYIGKGTAEATKSINKTGLNYEIIGNGSIIDSQMPVPGSKMSVDGMVYLYAKNNGDEDLNIIPDVRGLEIDKAIEVLTAAGLAYYTTDDYTAEQSEENDSLNGVYVKQMYPSPGIKVSQGTEIKLVIGK